MRLGQLARKLDLRPIDIVSFLAEKDIIIEDGTNTKVDDAHATLVVQHFAPTMSLGEVSTPDVQPPAEPVRIDHTPENVLTEADIPLEMDRSETDQKPEDSDVIKAPKIELSGLKIIGKIDLPEPKKKPEETTESLSDSEQPKEGSREKRFTRDSRPQRRRQNPISLQREQEALEAQRKREEELQQQKERRTQNYLKKVKAPQPTKAVKFVKEKTEQMSAAELAEPPKTLWGKFFKWLTT